MKYCNDHKYNQQCFNRLTATDYGLWITIIILIIHLYYGLCCNKIMTNDCVGKIIAVNFTTLCRTAIKQLPPNNNLPLCNCIHTDYADVNVNRVSAELPKSGSNHIRLLDYLYPAIRIYKNVIIRLSRFKLPIRIMIIDPDDDIIKVIIGFRFQ